MDVHELNECQIPELPRIQRWSVSLPHFLVGVARP